MNDTIFTLRNANYAIGALAAVEFVAGTASGYFLSDHNHRIRDIAACTIMSALSATSLTAGRFASLAAVSEAVSFTSSAVLWISGSGLAATTAAVGVGVGAYLACSYAHYRLHSASINSAASLAFRTAERLEDSVNSINWHSLQLNARSRLGLVSADELNALDGEKLSNVNMSIIDKLTLEELFKIKPNVLYTLSDADLILILRKMRGDLDYKLIRA